MQEYTQSGGVRLFGCCVLMTGYDRDGYHLFQIDPFGAYYELKTGALGKNRQRKTQNLERRYKDGLSIDDRLGIIISTLREGYDGVVQAHCMNFIVDIINCMLKHLGEKRRFSKISYDIKKKSIRKILKHLKKRNYMKFFFLILALNLQDLK